MPTPAQSAKVMLFNRGNKTGKHYKKQKLRNGKMQKKKSSVLK